MKVVFMGTPDFAVPALKALCESDHEICAVFTQPDKPKGRGYKLMPPPVKELAQSYGIPVFQPESLKRDPAAAVGILSEFCPDVIVVAAYGKILPKEVLELPRYGCVNIHGSLLPDLRGAAPIQYAVLLGYKTTGVTILQTVRKVDAGDMIVKKSLDILPYETNGELFERISQLGAEAIIEALDLIESGKAVFTPQDESLVTFSGKITAEMEQIDWTKPSNDIINLVRALNPSPVAWTTWGGKRLKLHALRPCDQQFEGVPGQVVQCTKKCVAVMCGDGKAVNVIRLQAENSKAMDINAFLCGKKFTVGEILGE